LAIQHTDDWVQWGTIQMHNSFRFITWDFQHFNLMPFISE
jgi:hypothetical protein